MNEGWSRLGSTTSATQLDDAHNIDKTLNYDETLIEMSAEPLLSPSRVHRYLGDLLRSSSPFCCNN